MSDRVCDGGLDSEWALHGSPVRVRNGTAVNYAARYPRLADRLRPRPGGHGLIAVPPGRVKLAGFACGAGEPGTCSRFVTIPTPGIFFAASSISAISSVLPTSPRRKTVLPSAFTLIEP